MENPHTLRLYLFSNGAIFVLFSDDLKLMLIMYNCEDMGIVTPNTLDCHSQCLMLPSFALIIGRHEWYICLFVYKIRLCI